MITFTNINVTNGLPANFVLMGHGTQQISINVGNTVNVPNCMLVALNYNGTLWQCPPNQDHDIVGPGTTATITTGMIIGAAPLVNVYDAQGNFLLYYDFSY
ncbi:hypothetical protein PVAG01_04424 [Phlyctema vagabunda]|uniref:Uncharacterized protein n=1 Tax=Phlyctema vagabunda TaxID=108571 RepID=A0ABR4PP86_9HELO